MTSRINKLILKSVDTTSQSLQILNRWTLTIMMAFSFLVDVVLNISGSESTHRLLFSLSLMWVSCSFILRLNSKVLDLVRKFNEQKKPIASLCHGPQVINYHPTYTLRSLFFLSFSLSFCLSLFFSLSLSLSFIFWLWMIGVDYCRHSQRTKSDLL